MTVIVCMAVKKIIGNGTNEGNGVGNRNGDDSINGVNGCCR